ncbi:MAG: hypothetical protein AAB687_01500 [Patescibacteria group bacterium]
MNAVKCLTAHIKGAKLSTRDKSSYYRSAIIIICSIVEGLAYEIVRKNTTPPDHIFEDTQKYSEICNIKSSVLGTASDVHLYRRQKVGLKIDDDGATFARYNLFLKHHQIISSGQYKTLDWMRRERNKLHIQGLRKADVDYTKIKLKRAAKAISFLVNKI